MSLSAMVSAPALAGLSTAADGGDSHFPPTPEAFWQPLVTFGPVSITRHMVVALLSVVILSAWLLWSTKNAQVVPSKKQWLTEQAYSFVRGGIAEDSIGSKEFLKYVPLLFSLFIFILFNNLMGIIPPVQMPTMSRIGFPIALVLIVYVVYHWIGIKKHGGLGGYVKWMIPPGIPGWLLPLIAFLEILTFFITRPLTLALRLFGNMFAGHMLLVVFILGGYELLMADTFALKFVAIPAWLMGVVFTAFEALVQFLQAYVFVLLAASYIGGALADDH
ncbi:F0F1 ATP synthase subunit A [Dermacoccaceae bacterium W4C1]